MVHSLTLGVSQMENELCGNDLALFEISSIASAHILVDFKSQRIQWDNVRRRENKLHLLKEKPHPPPP